MICKFLFFLNLIQKIIFSTHLLTLPIWQVTRATRNKIYVNVATWTIFRGLFETRFKNIWIRRMLMTRSYLGNSYRLNSYFVVYKRNAYKCYVNWWGIMLPAKVVKTAMLAKWGLNALNERYTIIIVLQFRLALIVWLW